MEDQTGQVETKIQKIKKHYNLHKRKVIILGLLVALMVVFFNLNPGKRIDLASLVSQPLEFAIVEATPRDVTATRSSDIVLKFNFPVTAHHAQEFIEVSPLISDQGKWEQGSAPNELIFKTFGQLIPGSLVTVNVKAGLPSEAGKKLATDFAFSFSVKIDGNDIQFAQRNESYKLASFDRSQGIDLRVITGEVLKQPRAVLYKAPNENALLKDLVYTRNADYNVMSIVWDGVYVDSIPQTNEFEEIDSFDLNETNKISYKGEPGIYYLAGYEGGKLVRDTWAVINKTGILFRQDDKKIVLAAQDLATKQEIKNIPVKFYQQEGKSSLVRSVNLNGITEIPFDYPNNRVDLIIGQNGNERIFVPVLMPSSKAEINVFENLNEKLVVFLTTERPIYKPGDTVKFRAVVRIDNDGAYRIPATGTELTIKAGGIAYELQGKTSAAGIISGEIKIPENRAPNPYGTDMVYLDATKGDKYLGNAFFEISQYKKPNFDLTVQMDKDELTRPEAVKAKIIGEYLNGQAMKNTDVEYIVYRRDFYETESSVYNSSFKLNEWGGMCGGGFGFWDEYYGEEIKKGSITLDDNGLAYIEIPTTDYKAYITQEITIVAQREDNGNKISGAKTAKVRAGEFNVFVNNKYFAIQSGNEFTVPFIAETRNGQKIINHEFDYRIYRVDYNYSGPNYTVNETDIKKGKVSTNQNGVGYVRDRIERDKGRYYNLFLEVTTTDSKGNKVGGNRIMYIVSENVLNDERVILGVVSEKNNLLAGQEAELKIEAPEDMNVLLSFERGRIYRPQWLDLKKGSNVLRFDVRDEFMPSITPTFAFFYNGQYHIEGLALNVPAMKNLVNVNISTDKTSYKTTDSVKVTIKTTDTSNKPVVADLSVSVVDRAIYALRKRASASIHSSFYFFRGRETNASSSLTGISVFGGGGNGGGGGGDAALAGKAVDTLFWNPEMRTDVNGTLTFEVPLTDYLTTWRIQAYASTSDTKVGQGTQDFLVNE